MSVKVKVVVSKRMSSMSEQDERMNELVNESNSSEEFANESIDLSSLVLFFIRC